MNYLNSIKVFSSFTVSSILNKPIIYGLPPAISIELTNHCNLRCPECPSGNGQMKRKKGFMETELFRKIVRELGPYLFNINLYFQGEPLLHPEFFEFIGIAGGIKTTVSTNGHFLDPENCERLALSGLNKLVVSLDGFDQETYSTYRVNGDFAAVKEGIITLSETVKKCGSSLRIIIQVLVNRYNENQVSRIKKFAEDSEVELALKSMQIYNEKESWLPASESFRRYEPVNGTYKIKGRMARSCSRLWFNPVVTWDGKVLPCCFDKDAEYVMGDMNTESFQQIWTGSRYKEFRLKLLKRRKETDICCNCTSGLPSSIRT